MVCFFWSPVLKPPDKQERVWKINSESMTKCKLQRNLYTTVFTVSIHFQKYGYYIIHNISIILIIWWIVVYFDMYKHVSMFSLHPEKPVISIKVMAQFSFWFTTKAREEESQETPEWILEQGFYLVRKTSRNQSTHHISALTCSLASSSLIGWAAPFFPLPDFPFPFPFFFGG